MTLKHLHIGSDLPTPAMEGIIDTIKGFFSGGNTLAEVEKKLDRSSRNINFSTYKKDTSELVKLIRDRYLDDSWLNKNIKDGDKTMGSFSNSALLSYGDKHNGGAKAITDPREVLASLKKAQEELDRALAACEPTIKKRAKLADEMYAAGGRTHDLNELNTIAKKMLEDNPDLKAGVFKNYKLKSFKNIPSLRDPMFGLNRYKSDYEWQNKTSHSAEEFDVWPKASCKDNARAVIELIEYSVSVVDKMIKVGDECSFQRLKHWDPENKSGLKSFLNSIPMHAGGVEMNTLYWFFGCTCADIVCGFYHYMFNARTSVK